MQKLTAILLILFFALSACGTPTKNNPVVVNDTPTAPTLLPTGTPQLLPSPTVEAPMIQMTDSQGNTLSVPDPKGSNPEFFDVTKSDSPIVKFASATNQDVITVLSGLKAEMVSPAGLPEFVVIRSADGTAILMAQSVGNEWQWSEATLGNYWKAQGKNIGVYVITEEENDPVIQNLLNSYFENGILAWGGDLSNTSGSSRLEEKANLLNASYFFHEVAEPGKFPKDVNAANADMWLDQRLDTIANSIQLNKTTDRPTYINFNEAFGETSGWNQEDNPLRNKYGDEWIANYITAVIKKFTSYGLVPNKDFVILFNDARLYNRPSKQDFIFKILMQARQSAFANLASDPTMKQKLSQMGINSADDIQIILGSETYTKLGSNEDDVNFWPAPTDAEMADLTEKFTPLGGVLMTEVDPFGNAEQKQQFLLQISNWLNTLPSLRGVIFWNALHNTDVGNPAYPLIADPLILFDYPSGSPTSLYYDLLNSGQ